MSDEPMNHSNPTDKTTDDSLNPTLKRQPGDPPFDCPYCKVMLNGLQMSPIGPVLVFWCKNCRATISVQMAPAAAASIQQASASDAGIVQPPPGFKVPRS